MHPSAKKSLGQHFLQDRSAVMRIVAAVPAGARILEIGPGPGALTEPLLERAGALAVIERDDRFAARWQARADEDARLSVLHGDVLELLDAAVRGFGPTWIVGNLPYNISGPLTAALASFRLDGGMVLMYQREVAERLLAGPGGKTYGGLSVLVRHHYTPSRLLTLPPGAFSPPPKVHSTVIMLMPHGREPACDYTALQRAVRTGFAHRRKTVANNFRGVLDETAWERLGIDPGCRPERLDYDAWVRIATALERC